MWIKTISDYIDNKKLGLVEYDNSFKNLTTLKVGGKISLLYFPNSIDSFLDFYYFYLESFSNIPLFIIGNGSNILASEETFNGIVVCLKKTLTNIEFNNNTIIVESGCSTKKFCDFLKLHSLGGCEALSTIPATIGGIIAMNATCFGYESKNYLVKCLVLDNNKLHWIELKDMDFGYRSSIFLKKKLIILKAIFSLPSSTLEDIMEKEKEVNERRKKTQPVNKKSAGSTFKNGLNYSAWELIDKAGLRGYTIGGASVSTLHTNFIINDNYATSSDIFNLMNYIKEVVYEKFGIMLESELIIK